MFKIKTIFKIDYYGKNKTIKYTRKFDDFESFIDFLVILTNLKEYKGFKVIEKKYFVLEAKK